MLKQIAVTVIITSLPAAACSFSLIRKLWVKQPGSVSRRFAFEQKGKVGFIDNRGRILVPAGIDPAGLQWTGDFIAGYEWLLENAPIEQAEEDRVAFAGPRKPAIRKFTPGKFEYMNFPPKIGFRDANGVDVIPAQFAHAGPFREGLAVAVEDGHCYRLSPDGAANGSPTVGVSGSCGGYPAGVSKACPTGFIDKSGRFSIPPIYQSARDFSEGLAAVMRDGQWGFVNRQGELVIPLQFEHVKSFREGLAAVKVNGKWGFIDSAGNLKIAAKFAAVDSFSEGLTVVDFKGGRFGYVDATGAVLIPGPFLDASPFVHGLAGVRVAGNRVRYIDRRGKSVFAYRISE